MKKLRFKKWVEVVLMIIALVSGMAMMYNVEISIIPFLIGSPIFYVSIGLLSEYGTIFDDLENKIKRLMYK